MNIKHLRELKAAFDAAHQEGMKGLQSYDLAAFGEAVRKEAAIADELSADDPIAVTATPLHTGGQDDDTSE